VKEEVGDITAIVGFVDRKNDIFNAAAILHNKSVVDVYHKMYLPNYGVFDEFRYFPGRHRYPFTAWATSHRVNICEILYPEGPSHLQSLFGAEVIVNSMPHLPYRESDLRKRMLCTRALDNA